MRVTSKKELTNGGWLHPFDVKQQSPPRRELPPAPTIDAGAILERWLASTDESALNLFAASLGVEADALRSLGCCRSQSHNAWAFPMRDGTSQIIGIRLRFDNGEKRALTGSRSGIFIPMFPTQHTCFICEGPTDTAAALSMGIFAIGRPSCSGGTTQLWAALRERRIRKAVIVADNDQDKTRPDGQKYNPGFDGASRLADDLDVPTCIFIPPAKDIREFLQLGGTKSLVDSMVNSLVWHQPKKQLTSPQQQRGTLSTTVEILCQEPSPFY